jgi:hypothetical protein
MKSKKFSKKLFLNRKTVANLSGSDMGNLHGGEGFPATSRLCIETDPCICPSYYTDCGTCTPSICQTACPLICK